MLQLRELDLWENPTLTDDILGSVARLTNLTNLKFGNVVDDSEQEAPMQNQPLYSHAALEQTISALPGICHVALALSAWEGLSLDLLLRISCRPNVTRSCQAVALGAVLGIFWSESAPPNVDQLAQTTFAAIPSLLALLEIEQWLALSLSNQEKFDVQVRKWQWKRSLF